MNYRENKFRISKLVFLFLFFPFSIFSVSETRGDTGSRSPSTTVAFNQQCENLLIERIDSAKSEILIAIYSFSLDKIASSLISKHKEGIRVRIKIDFTQANSKYCRPTVAKLRKAGIEVLFIKMPKRVHMHHKFVIIDRVEVITGSFNFTYTASKKNWENMISVEDHDTAIQFLEAWSKIRSRKKSQNSYGR